MAAQVGWQSVAATLAENGLPALGGLIGSMIMPGIGTTVGAGAGKLAATAIAGALGVEPTPEKIQAAVQADPGAAQVKLAQIEADAKAHADELADIQNARATNVQLAVAQSPIAYGPAVVSVVVILCFFGLCTLMLTMPGVRTDAFAQAMFYTILPLVVSVVSYWIGSSESAKRNADAVRNFAATTITPTPGQIAAKAIDVAGRKK